MKQFFLILVLLCGVSAFAKGYKYEITPLIGYNKSEGELDVKNNGYVSYGIEAQANKLGTALSPELSFYYGKVQHDDVDSATYCFRTNINLVYTFDEMASIIPFAKAGVGYEYTGEPVEPDPNGTFADLGAGVNIPLAQHVRLKLEAIYILKQSHHRGINNLLLNVGINFAFGKKSPSYFTAEVIEEKPVVQEKEVVELAKAAVVVKVVEKPKTVVVVPVIAETTQNANATVFKNLDVKFNFDSFKVKSSDDTKIQVFVDYMNANKNYDATIIGHTDSKGSKAYNQTLSQNRAKAVKSVMVKKGIDTHRLTTLGMGESKPVRTNSTKDGRSQNRRVEAQINKN